MHPTYISSNPVYPSVTYTIKFIKSQIKVISSLLKTLKYVKES